MSHSPAIYNHLDWNQNSGSWRFYWIGLSDLRDANHLEWVSTTTRDKPYNFKYWSVDGEKYDESRRCTFALFSNNLPAGFGQEGKWAKHVCTHQNSFICKINENDVVKECDSGWTVLDFGNGEKSCVKYYNTLRPWSEARLFCEDQGAGLLYVPDENAQGVINTYLADIKSNNPSYAGAWLDISDINSYDPENPEMEWYHHGQASYQNWVFGEPENSQSQWPGSTCGAIKTGSETTIVHNWSAEYCRNFNQYACQKRTGQTCPDGWFFQSFLNTDTARVEFKCYMFALNGRDHVPWYESEQYCKDAVF